ncbi:AIR carboxylase [Phycisphaerae bacterium RAS2]|nr:AIR carboxylase [Phycisphaerae bacterium RAS2]
MEPGQVRTLLELVRSGEKSVDDAMSALANLPFESLGYANVDHHRALRCGFPEVILCQGKSPAQVAGIFERLAATGGNVLATRASREHFTAVAATRSDAQYDEISRCITIRQLERRPTHGTIALVCAGTGDLPVIEEARITCDIMDQLTESYYDVGVAGIHRLLANTNEIRRARVVIVAAGMEGALASVVGGLVEAPVIAVPTSVGYGASFNGLAPLLTMLNSCAPGVSVVNIDNGFGAGYLASMINRMANRAQESNRS